MVHAQKRRYQIAGSDNRKAVAEGAENDQFHRASTAGEHVPIRHEITNGNQIVEVGHGEVGTTIDVGGVGDRVASGERAGDCQARCGKGYNCCKNGSISWRAQGHRSQP